MPMLHFVLTCHYALKPCNYSSLNYLPPFSYYTHLTHFVFTPLLASKRHVGMLFLPYWQERKKRMLLHPLCGERGIRTPVPLLATTRFPGVPLKPLEHLSSVKWSANILINFHLHQNL